jgi:subtilisin family serine protease
VDVYIIDSGVYEGHADFGGRATTIANFVNSEPQDDTCGHGKVHRFILNSFVCLFVCLFFFVAQPRHGDDY